VGRATTDPFFEQFLAEERKEIEPEFVRVIPDAEAEWMAVTKYSQEPFEISPTTSECLEIATEWVIQDLAPYVKSSLATTEEVCDYLDLSKNPGGLWMNTALTKWETLHSEEFMPWFEEHYWPSQFTEMPIYTLTAWFMKTEMRSRKKALENSLRSISGKSLEHIIAMNKFDLRFNLDFAHIFGGVSWSALGVPLVRGGWQKSVLTRLDRFPNSYEADVRLNDSTMHLSTHKCVQKVRTALADDHLAQLMARTRISLAWQNLWEQKFKGFQILSDGTVLFKWEGQDSGQCSTIVHNTIGSKIRFNACFIQLWYERFGHLPHKSDFEAHVSDLHLGDDLNFSTDDLLVPWFNIEKVAEWYRNEIGVFISTPTFEPRRARDVEFLSQTTSFERGFPIPALNASKMICSLRWGAENVRTVQQSLVRALAFRMATWAKPHEFAFVDSYVNWLIRRYGSLMRGEPEWDHALASHFTERELAGLWFPSGVLKAQASNEHVKNLDTSDFCPASQVFVDPEPFKIKDDFIMPPKAAKKRSKKVKAQAKPAAKLTQKQMVKAATIGAAIQAAQAKPLKLQSGKLKNTGNSAMESMVEHGMAYLKKHHPNATKAIEHMTHHHRQKQADGNASDANAQGRYYTASLLFPKELPGAKVPDIKVYRTCTQQTETHIVPASCTDGTGYSTMFVVTPCMAQLFWSSSASYTAGLPNACTAVDDGGKTFAAANWISKRLVSLEIRVRNATPAFTMGARWAMMRLPWSAGFQPSGAGCSNAITFAAFESLADCTVGNFEPNSNQDTIRFVWMPAGNSDLSFTSATTTVASDNTCIQFLCTGSNTQIIEVDVFANWEAKVLLASEQGITPTVTMGSEATAAESLSKAAQHPSLGSAAMRSEKSVWDVINSIAPKAMNMIPIVGEAFNWLGGAVASLFGKHTDRCLAFAQSLDEEQLAEVKRNVEAGFVPSAFYDALVTMNSMHVSLCDTAVRYCTPDSEHKVVVVKKVPARRDEFFEEKGGFRVISPDAGCPNCPPEYCVPAPVVADLNRRIDDLSALVEEDIKTARRSVRSVGETKADDDYERLSARSEAPRKAEYIGHPSVHRGYLKGGGPGDQETPREHLLLLGQRLLDAACDGTNPPELAVSVRESQDYQFQKDNLLSVEVSYDILRQITRIERSWRDGCHTIRTFTDSGEALTDLSRYEREIWDGRVINAVRTDMEGRRTYFSTGFEVLHCILHRLDSGHSCPHCLAVDSRD